MGQIFSLKNCLKEIASPHEYCLSQDEVRGPDRVSGPLFLKTKKNRILSLQRMDTDKLNSTVCFSRLKYSFFLPPLYVHSAVLTVANRSYLDVSVRQHIRKLSLFDKGFHFCYDVISSNGDQVVVNVYVLQSDEANTILQSIPYMSKHVVNVSPVESVISQMVGDITKRPVVSLWTNKTHALFLLTRGFEIVTRTVFSYDGDSKGLASWVIKNAYIQQALDAAKHRYPDESVSFLAFGMHYKEFQKKLSQKDKSLIDSKLENSINQRFIWDDYHGGYFKGKTANLDGLANREGQRVKKSIWNFGNKVQGKSIPSSKITREAVFTNPSLYGLSLCRESTTLISPDYRNSAKRFEGSRQALIASFAVFLLVGGLNVSSFFEQKKMEGEIEAISDSIEEGIRQVSSRIPDDQSVEYATNKARVKKQLLSEINAKNLLSWISNNAPKHSLIDFLSVEPEKEQVSGKKNNRKVKAKEKGEKRYVVDLMLKIDRDYPGSINQIDVFLAKINERSFDPVSKFIYKDNGDKVPSALSLKFFVKPGMFL